MRFLYIHGFASSPASRKAQTFRSALASHGVDLVIPAMDDGDFEHLLVSRQLSVIARTLRGEQACLIGSSMGGYLAALFASTHPEISRLVLMAPAFAFSERWQELARQRYGAGSPPEFFEVYHYGKKRMRQVHSRLIEEALEYPPYPDFSQPTLIFHGTADDTVPIDNSRDFVAAHPHAQLVELDSDHELVNVLDDITAQALPFLLSQTK